MKSKVLDYFDFERVNMLLEGFNQATGFVTALLDLDGNILCKSGWREICTDFHRRHPETLQNCIFSDTQLADRVKDGKGYHFYTCKNGLIDVAAPIIVDGKHIANLFSGQFFFEEPDISYFKNQAKLYGFDETAYLEALGKIPVVSKEQAETLMRFLGYLTKMIVDITAEKAEQIQMNELIKEKASHEEELGRERDRAKMYFDTANVIFIVINKNGTVVSINKRGCEILGYKEEDVLGKSWFEHFVPSSHISEIKSVFNQLLCGKLELVEYYENPVINAKGEERIISWHNNIIKDEEGNITDLLSAGNDITEKKRFEEALAESEEKFKYIFQNSPVAKSLTSIMGEIDVNDAFCRMLGYTKEELIGEKWQTITHPDDVATSQKEIQALINGEKEVGIFQKRYIKKDGSIVWGDVHTSIRRDQEGKPLYFMTVIIDITEKVKLEEQRVLLEAQKREQQKLEAIGTLASGVAHEINNPINGIMNYGQIIFDSEGNDEKIKEYAGEIIHETQRVSTIVKNLLDFSRQNGETHSKARIEDIIGNTLSLVQTVIKKDQIQLNVDIEENLPALSCRSQQIQQVLMNLMTNARDALNEQYSGHHKDKVINLNCSQYCKDEQQWIKIVVEDFGTGIVPEIKNKIFDPFFTTKDRDKGTGLGLSISYGIIKDHHGEMSVESEVGRYTRLIVHLPCVHGNEAES